MRRPQIKANERGKNKVNFEEEVNNFLGELDRREHPPTLGQERVHEIKEFIERKQPFEHAERYVARHILGMHEFKRIVALASISCFKPIHVIAIGDPASGKSEIAQAFQEITPRVRFCWGSKLTSAGLTVARLGNRLMVGVLPSCHVGTAVIDEFNWIPTTDASAVLATMAQQWFSIDKAFLKMPYVPSKLSVIGMANPRGDYFLSASPHQIKRQIPFQSLALLTRFNLVFIVLRPEIEEFQEISEHQLRYRMGRETCTFDQKERKLWQDAVLYLRHLHPNWTRGKGFKRRLIATFTTEAYREDKKGRLAVPVSPRLNEGISNLSEAYAKANMREEVYVRDVIKAIALVAQSLRPCGLNVDRAMERVAKVVKAHG